MGSIVGTTVESQSKKALLKPYPISRKPTTSVPTASTATAQNMTHGASPWPECRCSVAYCERSP